MQEEIKKIQNFFDSDPNFFITVWDGFTHKKHIETVNSQSLKRKYGGSFDQFLASQKATGIEKIRLLPRCGHIKNSKPYKGIAEEIFVTFSEVNQLPKYQPPTAQATPAVSTQTSGGMTGVDVGMNMAKAEIYKMQLENTQATNRDLQAKLDAVTKERDDLRIAEVGLKAAKDDAERRAKSAKKKAKGPKGLAGLGVTPEMIPVIIQNLPALLESLKGGGSPKLPATGGGQGTGAHARLQSKLAQWPEDLLKDLEFIVDRFNNGDQPQFVEDVQAIILKYAQPLKKVGDA
jgi:hypothetical protein